MVFKQHLEDTDMTTVIGKELMIDNLLAPIVLFVYNRADHTQKTLEALQNAKLSEKSHLFIFADGAKDNASDEIKTKIAETRTLIKSRRWCGEVTINESPINKGLAKSIIIGVTEIINKYGKVIVLEDDIVVGKHFLEYMNTALAKYKDNKNIWEITGFCDPLRLSNPKSVWFSPIEQCWSWATWADRWQYFKKDTRYYIKSFNHKMRKSFNADGADPGMWEQIEMNEAGVLNTWAIFWAAAIFEHHGLSCVPAKSLVKNIGFDGSGDHCGENPMEEICDSIDGDVPILPENVCCVSETEYGEFKRFMRRKNKPFRRTVRAGFINGLKMAGLYEILYRIIRKK